MSKVRTGICFLRSFPGFVPLFPLRASFFLSAFSRRSTVDGLTDSSSFLTSGVMRNGVSKNPICCRMKGASIFPHRYEKNAHIFRSTTTHSPEYFGFLPPPFRRLGAPALSLTVSPCNLTVAVFPQLARVCRRYFRL